MKSKSTRKAMMAIAALGLVALTACTQLQKDVGQCEGGVGDLSTLSNVTPANPC